MNTFELQSYLLDSINHKDFQIGVLASDELKSVTYQHFCIIVNSDPSNLPGQHWVCLLKRSKTIEFFDSFGKDIRFYGRNFEKFVQMHGGKVKYNFTQLQSNQSLLCGQYCLFFLIYRNLNVSFYNILNCFSQDFDANDTIVSTFFGKLKAQIKVNRNNKCRCKVRSLCIQRNTLKI